MANGKPAGVRCVQLDGENRCMLFGKPERPPVCTNLMPSVEMCRGTAEEAYAELIRWETLTSPTYR
jgi:uncharacterized protein